MRTTEKEALQAGLSREAFIEPIPLTASRPLNAGIFGICRRKNGPRA